MTGKGPGKSDTVPAALQETYQALTGLTDTCCKEHLGDEYATLCRRLITVPCRKRPSPLLRNDRGVWAAGIVHALGFVNFLSDSSRAEHMSIGDIAGHFGVKLRTVEAKSKQIRDLLGMRRFDPGATSNFLRREHVFEKKELEKVW